MNSIAAMNREIRYQLDYLSNFDVPGQMDLDNCLFIGSGDSYVAALIACYASNYKAIYRDPMEVAFNPEIIESNQFRRVYIVSISGNTQSNILAAKVSRRHKLSTTAITAKADSELARNCDEIIQLKYRNTGTTTSGTISFMSAMLCCLSLARRIDDLDHVKKIFRQASNQAQNLIDASQERGRTSSYIFLGDGILLPIAIYGTLKINEVFGLKAFAYSTEEFCHSPLFSLKRNDKVIMFANKTHNLKYTENLKDRLTNLGFRSAYAAYFENVSLTELLIKSTLFTQLLVLKQALRTKVKDCFFLRDKNFLKLSSDLIYHR